MKSHNPIDRARSAFQKAVSKANVQAREHATVGWRKTETSVLFSVPGRPGHLYITMGNQTVYPALNRANVPHQAFLPVWVVLENDSYVIVARDNANAEVLANVPDSPYGVPAHPLGTHSDTHFNEPYTDGHVVTWDGDEGAFVLAAQAVTSVNGQTGDVVLDADDIDDSATTHKFTDAASVGAAIHGADAKTTPVDADTLPLIDSEASNVLKKVTWANIKATLKSYFDTLYATVDGWIKADGTIPLTGDWDIGEDRAIKLERLQNRDAEGLTLNNSSGNPIVEINEFGRIDAGGLVLEEENTAITITQTENGTDLYVFHAKANNISGVQRNVAWVLDPNAEDIHLSWDDDTIDVATFKRDQSVQFHGGITFGNETLSVYDEGTWSPTITGTTNPTVSYTAQSGNYVRINNLVFYTASITINTVSGGTGSARFSLPLSVATGAQGVFVTSGVDVTPGMGLSNSPQAGTSYTLGLIINDNAAVGTVQCSGLGAGDVVTYAGFYFTS